MDREQREPKEPKRCRNCQCIQNMDFELCPRCVPKFRQWMRDLLVYRRIEVDSLNMGVHLNVNS